MQAGHAFAAAAEGVGIHHVAAFSVLLLPGALIALDTETMAVLSPARTLRVCFSPSQWQIIGTSERLFRAQLARSDS